VRLSGQAKIAFGLAGASLILLLGGFALALQNSQSDSRDELEERFSERPQVSAALTEALFATTASPDQQQELQERYSGPNVTEATLTKAAAEEGNLFTALIGSRGDLIAISEGTPPQMRADLEARPQYVTNVLNGDAPYSLSDVLDFGSGGERVVVFAQAFKTPSGPRVLVNGFPPELLSGFLGGYLAQVPNVEGGQAYVLDSTGAVIASADMDIAAGEPVGVEGLTEAIDTAESGTFGNDQYFAASPVANTPWRIVATAPEDVLFETVSGWDHWTPWLILVALTLIGLAAMLLLLRVLRGGAELADANARLEASSQALRDRAVELERSNAELDQFALIASHDLQEPLRKVQMFSQKVIDSDSDGLSEQGRDYLRRSSAAAARMQALIQDLLSLSRISTHRDPFEECDLGQLTRAAVSDLEHSITAAGAVVEVGSLPTVTVDESQVRQLMQNLISNAVKFRRPDVPAVVRIEGETRGRYAEIRVSDNGIGFEPRHATRIFRVFERLHGRSEYPGTGIGLALCRKIVERHGGTIAAESTPGEGATFVFTLPIDQDREPMPFPAAVDQDEDKVNVPG
jgi:signal transduction histidine kinase